MRPPTADRGAGAADCRAATAVSLRGAQPSQSGARFEPQRQRQRRRRSHHQQHYYYYYYYYVYYDYYCYCDFRGTGRP